jgi:hypothetical protein
MIVKKYLEEKYNFRGLIENFFEAKELKNLHLQVPEGEKYDKLFEVGKDSSTIFHEKFYSKLKIGWPELVNTYEQFLLNVVLPDYNFAREEIVFQKTPTFRVHLPNNLAVGDFHRDRDYNHPEGEINFIIPLTYMYGTNTVWCESEYGKKDYHPVQRLNCGEYFMFDGNNLFHGNMINKTGFTRVSMDFRILPRKFYNTDSVSSSLTTKTKFIVGEYYKEFV